MGQVVPSDQEPEVVNAGFVDALDCGDELAIFADADHARCLRTRRLISAYYILYNGVLVSWACKKQPVTALHSTASEITALHKGATKTVLLRSFLQ